MKGYYQYTGSLYKWLLIMYSKRLHKRTNTCGSTKYNKSLINVVGENVTNLASKTRNFLFTNSYSRRPFPLFTLTII